MMRFVQMAHSRLARQVQPRSFASEQVLQSELAALSIARAQPLTDEERCPKLSGAGYKHAGELRAAEQAGRALDRRPLGAGDPSDIANNPGAPCAKNKRASSAAHF